MLRVVEHSFFTLSRFSSRDGWAISPTCCRSSKAEVNTLLADQKDLWQQEQWTAAPGGSLDFSAVVVKFKSDAAQLKNNNVYAELNTGRSGAPF